MKHYLHYCSYCWYFIRKGPNIGVCVNCDSPGSVRTKHADDVCDGGGDGSDYYGFVPRDGKRK